MTRKKGKEESRLILDRDLPEQVSNLEIWANPVDVDEASQFTLEAKLVKLASRLTGKKLSTANQRATNTEIKSLMKQAAEDRDKLSKRGLSAFDYLESTRKTWDVK